MSTLLIASTAYAGGSIFGGHKHKSSNPYGVYAINVHVCSDLECPPVRIIEGSCDGDNMVKRYGVCVCEAGYVANGATCAACPEGQYSDGINACQSCPEGQYIAHDGDTECSPCPSEHYCKNGQAFECPNYAVCSDIDFECHEGFTTTPTACLCAADKYIDDDDECKKCPEHASCDGEKYTCTNGYNKTDTGCICDENKFEEDGKCLENKCVGITLNQCQESCDPKTGQITNKTTKTPCDYEGTNDGECYVGHCNPQGCPVSTEPSYYTSLSPEDCAKCFGATSTYYGCFACPQLGQSLSWPDDSSCSACGDARWAAGHCAICNSNKVITLNYGSCVSCPAEGSSVYPVNQSDCLSKCSGASWRSDGLCIRCANGIIRLDTYSCVSCPAEGSSVFPTNQSDCLNKCSGASWSDYNCSK